MIKAKSLKRTKLFIALVASIAVAVGVSVGIVTSLNDDSKKTDSSHPDQLGNLNSSNTSNNTGPPIYSNTTAANTTAANTTSVNITSNATTSQNNTIQPTAEEWAADL
jgi:hypothetical protein